MLTVGKGPNKDKLTHYNNSTGDNNNSIHNVSENHQNLYCIHTQLETKIEYSITHLMY